MHLVNSIAFVLLIVVVGLAFLGLHEGLFLGYGIIIGCGMAFILSFILGAKERESFMRRLANDESFFAKVVRKHYQEDPIGATALWKRVHPTVIPPWHQEAERKARG